MNTERQPERTLPPSWRRGLGALGLGLSLVLGGHLTAADASGADITLTIVAPTAPAPAPGRAATTDRTLADATQAIGSSSVMFADLLAWPLWFTLPAGSRLSPTVGPESAPTARPDRATADHSRGAAEQPRILWRVLAGDDLVGQPHNRPLALAAGTQGITTRIPSERLRP